MPGNLVNDASESSYCMPGTYCAQRLQIGSCRSQARFWAEHGKHAFLADLDAAIFGWHVV